MRILFWLLLLANLLLFSYVRWGDVLTGGQADLQAQPPLNADKVEVVSAPAAAPT